MKRITIRKPFLIKAILFFALGVLLLLSAPLPEMTGIAHAQGVFFHGEGWLSAYHPVPSAATMAYRYDLNHVQWGADAYIAVADCSLIGHTGTMEYIESGLVLDVQVFDCAGADGVDENGEALITKAGFIAELDAASHEHYGLGKVKLTIDD